MKEEERKLKVLRGIRWSKRSTALTVEHDEAIGDGMTSSNSCLCGPSTCLCCGSLANEGIANRRVRLQSDSDTLATCKSRLQLLLLFFVHSLIGRVAANSA